MRLLLDTQIVLAAAGQVSRLPAAAADLINDPDNELLFSAASVWEVVIKSGLGRADFKVEPRILRRGLLEHGYVELPISGAHALQLETLPPIHRDPFDRILAAQALSEGVTLVTTDAILAGYPGPIRRV